jgi:hypothetical protein
MLGLAHRGFSIHDMDQHLCRFLGRNGYETVLCGMQHESSDPLLIGYDRVSISSKREAEDLTAWDNENADAPVRIFKNRMRSHFSSRMVLSRRTGLFSNLIMILMLTQFKVRTACRRVRISLKIWPDL